MIPTQITTKIRLHPIARIYNPCLQSKITYYPDSSEIQELQNDTTNFISYRNFNWSLLCS